MSNRRKIVILLLIIIGIVVLGNVVRRKVLERLAADQSSVILTQDYSLSDTVSDPLVVIADTVDLSGDSHVTGNAALVGRTKVTLAGQVSGDLAALGDDIRLEKNGHISGNASLMGSRVVLDGQVDGDLTVVSDTLTINSGAQVNGNITACVSHLGDERSGAALIIPCSDAESAKFAGLKSLRDGQIPLGGINAAGGFPAGELPISLSLSLALTGLAALAVTVFPRPFSYLVEAMQAMPRRMAGMGCLTSLLALGGNVVLLVILADVPVLGLLLLPVGALLGLLLLGMVITGWIALALVIGTWLAKRVSSRGIPPLIAVAFGSVLLFLLWHMLALLPFGGLVSFVLMVVFGSVGLGAALTTRLGTRPLRRSYFVQG
jgi:Polymer-forming cytoskeletal